MKPTFLERIRYWCGGPIAGDVVETEPSLAPDDTPEYLRSFGANNVPVEDLGAEPMGWEKAP